MNNKILNSLQKLFKIGYNKNAYKPEDRVHPLKNKDGIHFEKEKFPPFIKEFLSYWMSNCHDSRQSWEGMEKVFEDMDLLYYNCIPISRAINLGADEVVQYGSNKQCIGVEADKKQKKDILELFDNIGLFGDKTRVIAENIIHYGNAGSIISLENNGVTDLSVISPYQIKDRIEFTPYQVAEKIKSGNKFLRNYRSNVERIDMLIKSIEDKENINSYFKTYLFGFQIADRVLPPWRFLHFRNYTEKTPFKPFGIPVFIHAMSPYRQYDMAMTLQAAKRAAQIPLDVYKLNIPNEAASSPTEKLMLAVDFFKNLFNMGLGKTKKEETGIGEVLVTINDLFEYEQISSTIDLGKIDDIDFLREDVFDSSWLPRFIVDPRDSGFGESGVALVQRWKPFARLVYRIQNIILEQYSLLVKIHLIHTGNYTPEEINFNLTMPFPESQVDSDLISNQSDLWDLANGILDSLNDKIMDGEGIPIEIIKDVYNQILPYDDKKIDSWLSVLNREKSEITEKKWKKIKESKNIKLLKEEINNEVFRHKNNFMKEGIIHGNHFYSSKIRGGNTFDPNKLYEFKAQRLKEKKSTDFKEKNTSQLPHSND